MPVAEGGEWRRDRLVGLAASGVLQLVAVGAAPPAAAGSGGDM